MNSTMVLTYYYDDPDDDADISNLTTTTDDPVTSSTIINTLINKQVQHLQSSPHANPALVHHLYLGLSHMGKVTTPE